MLQAAIVLLGGAGSVQAQSDPAAPAQQVTVVGSRLPVSASGLAQNVTVIDARQIQELNPARVEDILSQLGGVYVDAAGSAGGFSSLYLRGGENSHLMVMIDGVKVNDPTTTRGSAYDLSSIDVGQLERIEILRGPASAIHGGEALSGVINFITRRPAASGLHGTAHASLGQGHHARAGATLAIGSDSLVGQLSLGTVHDGDAGDDARLRLNTLSASLRLAPGGSIDGEIFGHRAERNSSAFADDSGGPRLAVVRDKTVRDATDSTFGVHLGWGDPDALRVQARASVYRRSELADNAAIDGGVRFPVPAFTSDSNFRRRTLQLTAERQWSGASSLVVGVEHQNERGDLTSVGVFGFGGDPDVLSFELDRSTDSVFAEGRFEPMRGLALQLGVRNDKVQGLAAQTTPHLGLVWTLPGGATALKASFSKGFKPPSFFALGFPIGANPDLKPERSSNTELTLVQRLGSDGSSAQVSVYQIDYQDLVDFDANTFSNVNRGKIVVKGIEPALNVHLGRQWHLQATATLLDISVRDGLQPLRNRPEQRLTANLVWDMSERSSAFVMLNHSGGFLDRSNPTGDIDMPGFSTIDVGGSLRMGALRFKLALDNLLDRHYEQFVGFPAQGRRLRAELRAEF
jgi:outer membrane cobalamin receptor